MVDLTTVWKHNTYIATQTEKENIMSKILATLILASLSFAAAAAPVADHDDFAAIREATAPTALVEAVKLNCGAAVDAQKIWDGLTVEVKLYTNVVDTYAKACSTFGIEAN